MTVPAGQNSAHIQQLEAGRLYDIILVAEKGSSQSEPAATQVTPGEYPGVFRTAEVNEMIFFLDFCRFRTNEPHWFNKMLLMTVDWLHGQNQKSPAACADVARQVNLIQTIDMTKDGLQGSASFYCTKVMPKYSEGERCHVP